MASPAKKRKLNSGSKESSLPSRGIEYFFSKRKKDGSPSKPAASALTTSSENNVAEAATEQERADEEFAKRLQAEWNEEPHLKSDSSAAIKLGHSDGNVRDISSSPEKLASTVTPELSLSVLDDRTTPSKGQSKNTLSLQSVAAAEDHISESLPLDENPLTFEPSKYIRQLQEQWAAEGGNASYALLTRCFVLVNGTQSRIKIVDTLVNCLRLLIEADPSSLLPAVGSPVSRAFPAQQTSPELTS